MCAVVRLRLSAENKVISLLSEHGERQREAKQNNCFAIAFAATRIEEERAEKKQWQSVY